MNRKRKCIDILNREITPGDCVVYIDTSNGTKKSELDICEVLEVTPKGTIRMVPWLGDKRVILKPASRTMIISHEELPDDVYFKIQEKVGRQAE
jgi:hypothetical protein